MKEQIDLLEQKRNELVAQVYADFARRQEERRRTERGWQLNINFINGNQYCDVNLLGELEEENCDYYWQERRCFNHIAPTVDTRCSKLAGIRPRLTVRAASDEDGDRQSARLSSAILNAAYEDCSLDDAVSAATSWSEACGTAFYKVIWDADAGKEIGKTFEGKSVCEGKVKVVAVSPFEIYPETLTEEDLYNQPSIIHARAASAEDIFSAYGVRVEGRDVDELSTFGSLRDLDSLNSAKAPTFGVKHGYEVVIERYIRPDSHNPDGRLTIVAGGKLLYDGILPYINGESGLRTYPFIKQCSLPVTGKFFGSCVVDRLIPVQRAYNAVKNRKHEFLNRISMGMLAVEEGSVDTDDLTEDGLVPGKVIVYRQGGTPPQMLTLGSVPAEFTQEEERLEEEFSKISGTNDLTQKANAFTSVTSATGLQLLIEQDDARLNVSCDQIKGALRKAGKMILRLYKQFASSLRLLRYAGKNGSVSVVSFKGSDITGDDVVIEADNETNLTPARRRAALYDMLDRGLFSDEDGKISPAVKSKLLECFGYNGFTPKRDLEELNVKRCAEENSALREGNDVPVKPYDDDKVHVREHTAYLLTEKLDEKQEARICAHLQLHKNKISEVNEKYEG